MPAKKRERLILLDAHAIIHRAYHALPEFQAPDGSPTGALYGLSAMLLKIIQELSPDYIAACYDLPKPTVRHEVYADYKGKRQTIEDSLRTQIGTSRRVFEAFSIPIYEREGFEADDILGTIAKELESRTDIEIVIASGDMDTLQLVDKDRVKVYTLKKGLNDTVMYDEKAVTERFGFDPERIPDYKGLRGDPSDNIIGVPGIGEKTATELITTFGSIEDIYKAIKKNEDAVLKKGVKPRILNLLKEHEEDALFSKMLATIRTDAPIAFSLEKTKREDHVSLPKITALFDELGFRSLRARVRVVLAPDAEVEEEPEEETVREEVPEDKLQEAEVMLWLLMSDFTNPTLEDVLGYTKKQSFEDAYKELEKRIGESKELTKVYETIEKPLMPVLRKAEACGVLIDRAQLEALRDRYRKELSEIEARIYAAAGKEFNISSPKQLGDVLFDDLQLQAKGQKKTSTGQRSTKESELEKIRELHPIVDDILEYRQIGKLLSTYVESIPPLLDSENRLHTKFVQTGTTTGRMASINPNLQNIPIRTERGRLIRNAFVAPKGSSLVALDYSQFELRLAAILSKDEKLMDIFRSGRDVHQEVAAAVFGVPSDAVDREMRRRAKVINFGILYGMGVNALRTQLGTTTAEAHRFYDDYFETFKRLSEYLEETKGFARKNGYTETMFGRRRQFPEMRSPLPYVRAQAERMAINAPIQGTEADIMKLAMIKIDALLKDEPNAHLILQVHDELVYEMKSDRVAVLVPQIKKIMETIVPENETHGVPILVEAKAGHSWGEMEHLPL